MLLISDGLPYEDGYEGRYAQEDTRVALNEAESNGTGCVCVNVTMQTHEQHPGTLWGGFTYVHIKDPLALSEQVESLFRTALNATLQKARRRGTRRGVNSRAA